MPSHVSVFCKAMRQVLTNKINIPDLVKALYPSKQRAKIERELGRNGGVVQEQALVGLLPDDPKVINFPEQASMKEVVPALHRWFTRCLDVSPLKDLFDSDVLRSVPSTVYDASKVYINFGLAATDGHVDDLLAVNLIFWALSGPRPEPQVSGVATTVGPVVVGQGKQKPIRTAVVGQPAATWLFVHANHTANVLDMLHGNLSPKDVETLKGRCYFRSDIAMSLEDFKAELGVRGIPFIILHQFEGEAVLVPAYCLHVVWTHVPCVKVARDGMPAFALHNSVRVRNDLCGAERERVLGMEDVVKALKAGEQVPIDAQRIGSAGPNGDRAAPLLAVEWHLNEVAQRVTKQLDGLKVTINWYAYNIAVNKNHRPVFKQAELAKGWMEMISVYTAPVDVVSA
jgi:hypothetical protein